MNSEKPNMSDKEKNLRDEADSVKLRRNFLKLAVAMGAFLAGPAFAFDLMKMLDPEGKNKDIQKARQILQGAGNIMASSTDLDYNSECAIGESLALEGFHRYGTPVKDVGLQKYVNLVGNAAVRNSTRSHVPFHFIVTDSPLYNAFACPGGIIFVCSTLLKAMNDESELAGVLSHEVAHVGHKHALQTIKRAKFFKGINTISVATMKGEKGKKFQDMIGNLQAVLFDKGLDKDMEFEADLSGMEIAYRTGYDPAGIIRLLGILKSKEDKANKAGSWFSTHPPLSERIRRCKEKLAAYPDSADMAKVEGRFLTYKKRL